MANKKVPQTTAADAKPPEARRPSLRESFAKWRNPSGASPSAPETAKTAAHELASLESEAAMLRARLDTVNARMVEVIGAPGADLDKPPVRAPAVMAASEPKNPTSTG